MPARRPRVVASKPSRKGCRTCRTRRVKCDERRPVCERCVSTGRICDGYTVCSSRRGFASKPALLPSKTTPTRSELPSTPRYVAWNASVTDIERNAFAYFLQDTAPSLGRIFRSQQWLQLALQAGAEMPMIFNAITAVGCMAHARAQILVTDHALTQLKTNLKEEIALAQYCKATLSLQRYIDAAIMHGADVEPVLICSLLFVLFETFRGEPALASSHLRHGRRALEHAAQQSQGSPDLGGSKVSNGVMKELLSTFHALDSEYGSSQSSVDDQSTLHHLEIVDTDGILLSRLNTIWDAKHSLHSLIAETTRWRDELLMLTESYIQNIEQVSAKVAARRCMRHCLSRSIDISRHSTLLSRKHELVEAHERWLQILNASCLDLGHQNLRLLQIQHFYSYFLISTSRDTTELPLHRFDNVFKWAFDLVERYLDYPDGLSAKPTKPASSERQFSFSLEAGPLSVLFLISLKCFNQETRQRAMDLLRQANRREGLQWSGELSIYADCIVEFEDARAKRLGSAEHGRPLDWWFQRIPQPAGGPKLVAQGVGYHDIRILGCRYLQEDCKEMEMIELRGAGLPPLHLQELSRINISCP